MDTRVLLLLIAVVAVPCLAWYVPSAEERGSMHDKSAGAPVAAAAAEQQHAPIASAQRAQDDAAQYRVAYDAATTLKPGNGTNSSGYALEPSMVTFCGGMATGLLMLAGQHIN